MTRKLLFLRHGKSSWSDPYLSDHDRPLANRGKKNAPKMAKLIREICPDLELILCSSSTRTQETLELVKKEISYSNEILILNDLYLASKMQIWKTINENVGNFSSILVIAHNPGLGELVSSVKREINDYIFFPTCALASLKSDKTNINGWISDDFELVSIFRPRELSSQKEY